MRFTRLINEISKKMKRIIKRVRTDEKYRVNKKEMNDECSYQNN